MQILRSAETISDPESRPVSAKTLRGWCAPEVILVVTDLSDELMLMSHIINQARHSSAKIILANVVTLPAPRLQGRCLTIHRSRSGLQQARAELDRMARHLRWLGFICEPLVLSGRPEIEIAALA